MASLNASAVLPKPRAASRDTFAKGWRQYACARAQDALTVMQEASPCLLILHPESLLSKNVDGVFARTSILHGKSSQSLTLSIQNSILRLAVCILHPTETQSPSHIQNAKDTPTSYIFSFSKKKKKKKFFLKDTPTITSLRNYNYVIPPTKWPARAPYRALPAIRWPHAGRHLALVTFVHPT